jgi:zinc protease
LFGETDYGLDSLGTEESVAKIAVAGLKSFHQKLTTPNNCVLAIYGDVDTAAVKAAVTKAFGSWKPASAQPALNLQPSVFNSQRVEEIRDKKQAVLVIGFPGTTMASEDRYALDILQECCSDLGSRLFLRIREQLGLAYYVGAQNFAGLVPGYFAFYTGTEPAKVAQVETELLKEAELLRTEGLTAAELNRAKAKIIGQKKISRADLGHLASTSALDELYGLGWQRAELDDAKYETVTLEQIKAVAQKYLKLEALVVAVVKP